MYRELGDVGGMAGQLIIMGYAAIIADPTEAVRLFQQGIEAYEQAGGPPEMGQAMIGMALPQMQLGRLEEARRHLEEAAALFREAGDDTMALITDGLLGVCFRLEGDLTGARRSYVDVLVRTNRARANTFITLPLQALADLALLEGDPERAVILDAAQAGVAERFGGTPSLNWTKVEPGKYQDPSPA